MADEGALRDYLKRVTARLQQVQSDYNALAAAGSEPIAIVGMGCRYPGGVRSPEDLWNLVVSEREVISGFPADRGWEAGSVLDPAESTARVGGFLEGAAEFDAEFFGISPREALAMDPQQRVLLEVAWEAVENCCIAPDALQESEVGVFIGVFADSYGKFSGDEDSVAGYRFAGMNCSVASGRLAYVLGLRGPAVSVDTACSSSLVALHQGVNSLRAGECTMALVGGVTVMSTPWVFTEFSRQGGLAADGRCKAFADAADGTVFAEGAGVLVLQRLSDAQRDGRPVLAVIRGSAINQDGASNGLTAPNGPAQQRVIRAALGAAGLEFDDIDAVEAHGTGTALGDPIEAQALLATYGRRRAHDQPVLLGSVKSNLGHTQAAAGMAGLIKMVMALQHRRLPRTLHVDAPSRHVNWAEGGVELLTRSVPWPATRNQARTRRAAVSSFGISGTNAHVILEEAPPHTSQQEEVSRPPAAIPWILSARSESALRAQAARLSGYLSDARELSDSDVGHALAVTRTRFEHRAVVVGDDGASLRAGVAALSEGRSAPGLVYGQVRRPTGGTAFIFPGQGAQWPLMGTRLLRESVVFAAAMQEAEEILSTMVEWSLLDVLSDPHGVALENVEIVQPASFAVMVSLARLWQSFGIEPDVVLGHSQGEIAAAHIAGVLSLRDALRVVVQRGRALAGVAGQGRMAAVSLSPRAARPRLADDVVIAAVNSPSAVVISGAPAGVEAFVAECDEEGIFARLLPVDYASHSRQVDVIQDRLIEALGGIVHEAPTVRFWSSLTGTELDPILFGSDYWFRSLRAPVQFYPAVSDLLRSGISTFIEVSSHPVLTSAIGEAVEAAGLEKSVLVTGSLCRDDAGLGRLLTAVADVEVAGGTIDWSTVFAGTGRKNTVLPTYAFQRRRYWLAPPSDGSRQVLRHTVSISRWRWLQDHVVDDEVLLPGSVFVEMALGAVRAAAFPALREMTLQAPLVLDDRPVDVEVRIEPVHSSGCRALSIHSRVSGASTDAWRLHATGELGAVEHRPAAPRVCWPPNAQRVDVDEAYRRLQEAGYRYGPAFRSVTAIWTDSTSVYAEVELAGEISDMADDFVVHPVLLDAALQLVLLTSDIEHRGEVTVPFAFNDIEITSKSLQRIRVCMTRSGSGMPSLAIADQNGMPIGSIGEVVMRPLAGEPVTAKAAGCIYRVRWTPTTAGRKDTGGALRVHTCAAGSDPAAVRRITGEVLRVLQHWLRRHTDEDRLAVVTTGAIAMPDEDVTNLAGAAVWGLVRAAQSEHPGRLVLVDTDHSLSIDDIGEEQTQLVIRNGSSYEADMVAVEETAAAALDLRGATVLITGGTGMAGSLIAKHVSAAYSPARIVMLSRRGPQAPGAPELVGDLSGSYVQARVIACDVSQRDEIAAVLQDIPRAEPIAVIHAAGILDDGGIDSMTQQRMESVLASKADAALHLHELTGDRDVRAFIMFSSIAGILGTAGQANYAAANAVLDGLATHRRAQGLHGQSLAWGWWAQESDLTKSLGDSGAARLRRIGLVPMTADETLAIFDNALRNDNGVLVTARLDRGAIPLRLGRVGSVGGTTPSSDGGGVAPRLQLSGLETAEQRDLLIDLICESAAEVLNHEHRSALGSGRTFRQLGFDSLSAVELRNRLNNATGVKLKQSAVFDFPTPEELAEVLRKTLVGELTDEDLSLQNLDGQLDQLNAGITALTSSQAVTHIEKRLRQLLATCRMYRELG
jgi:pimaricinolide synthase PimS1